MQLQTQQNLQNLQDLFIKRVQKTWSKMNYEQLQNFKFSDFKYFKFYIYFQIYIKIFYVYFEISDFKDFKFHFRLLAFASSGQYFYCTR